MQATENLEIIISADIKDAVKGVTAVDKALLTIPAAANKAGAALSNNLTKGSNTAAQSLQNLGRIAQDAPFGFIGIQNNINPLIESFQRLKAETGSTGGALKALAGSLTGAGGLGLVISLASAALLVLPGLFKKTGDEAEKAAEEIKNFSDTVVSDITKVGALTAIADDTTRSYKERKDAIAELRKEYPNYLKGLSDEKLLTDGVRDATEAVTSALIKRGIVLALQETVNKKIAETIKKSLDDLKLYSVNAQDLTDDINGLNKATTRLNTPAEQAAKNYQNFVKSVMAMGPQGQSQFVFQEVKKEIQGLLDVLGASSVVSDFQKKLDSAGASAKDIVPAIEDIKLAINSIEGLAPTTSGIIIAMQPVLEQEAVNKAIKDVQDFARAARAAVDANAPLDLSKIGMTSNIKAQVDLIIKALQDAKAKAAKELQDFKNLIENTAVSAVEAAATGIGQALAGVKNPFAPLISVLADGLIALGKTVISTSELMVVLKKALAGITANPIGGVVVGAALIALGAFLKAKVASQKFAEGGVVSGPLNAQIGEAGQSEAIIPLSRLSGMMNNNRGGNILETRVSGSDLLIILNRASASYNRTFG